MITFKDIVYEQSDLISTLQTKILQKLTRNIDFKYSRFQILSSCGFPKYILSDNKE